MAYAIQVSLNQEVYNKLDEVSKETKIPKSRILSNAFIEWLAKEEQEKLDRKELEE